MYHKSNIHNIQSQMSHIDIIHSICQRLLNKCKFHNLCICVCSFISIGNMSLSDFSVLVNDTILSVMNVASGDILFYIIVRYGVLLF